MCATCRCSAGRDYHRRYRVTADDVVVLDREATARAAAASASRVKMAAQPDEEAP
jgi:hypothetical protein